MVSAGLDWARFKVSNAELALLCLIVHLDEKEVAFLVELGMTVRIDLMYK